MSIITQKIPPRLSARQTEIFWDDEKQDLFALHEGRKYRFINLPKGILQTLQQAMEADEEAMAIIEAKGPAQLRDRLWLYCKCKFGAFSYEPDLHHGVVTPENWVCGCNSNCILKPLHNKRLKVTNGYLSQREYDVLRALCAMPFKIGTAVAANLSNSEHTLNKHKHNLYAKVGVHSIQELAVWASKMSLI